MTCEIIQDLLPLYADQCCSEASRSAVEAHLTDCKACRALLQSMETPLPAGADASTPVPVPQKIRLLRASVLQSVLFLLSFFVLALGVRMEAGTPAGPRNGNAAYDLIAPAAAFLFSLLHWHFIRFYRSRKRFILVSGLLTAGLTLLFETAFALHYSQYAVLPALSALRALPLRAGAVFEGFVLLFSAVLLLLSCLSAGYYASYVGKE